MKKITAVLVGAGGRGHFAYAPYAKAYPHELEFVAVAEPIRTRRESFAEQYGIPPEGRYESWEHVFEKPRLADVMIICTQDRMHYEPAIRALAHGYHVLLEKPMSNDPKECIEMAEAAKRYDRLLTICHVLRYTPFWSAIKTWIEDGKIGDVVSIQLNENVGFYHMAHSFVRGNWRNAEQSSPMILAKSCHDMDLLAWLVGKECVRVSSFGSLMHFHEKQAPAGSTERCTDGCAAEPTCPYSAMRIYLRDYRDWARFITDDLSNEGIVEALNTGPYGRCVYRCDNNVVDHQVVNLEFAGGATASFTMCGFTHDCSRSVQVMGTKGEIRGYMTDAKVTLYDFATGEQTELRFNTGADDHGGGDERIMRRFLHEVRHYAKGSRSLTSAEESVQSHLMAFAAEQSRLNGGTSIDLADYRRRVLGG